jgi:hypothetical protein
MQFQDAGTEIVIAVVMTSSVFWDAESCEVRWRSTDSLNRVEEYAQQETSMKQVANIAEKETELFDISGW